MDLVWWVLLVPPKTVVSLPQTEALPLFTPLMIPTIPLSRGQYHGHDTYKGLFETQKPRWFRGSGASPTATLGVLRG